MSINKLTDIQLVKEYKVTRNNFVFAMEGSQQEAEFEQLYDILFEELNNRNIDLRKYLN
jgi:hypothetical protein